MYRRRIPFLIRAIILFLASLPVARTAASPAEAHNLRGAHVHDAGIAERAGLVVPAVVATGVALLATSGHIEERPVVEAGAATGVSRLASSHDLRPHASAAWTGRSRAMVADLLHVALEPVHLGGLPLLPSLAPFPYKARSLAGTLTARAP